jgi:hypothetical protein
MLMRLCYTARCATARTHALSKELTGGDVTSGTDVDAPRLTAL